MTRDVSAASSCVHVLQFCSVRNCAHYLKNIFCYVAEIQDFFLISKVYRLCMSVIVTCTRM